LRAADPAGEAIVPLHAVDHPAQVHWRGDEVVLLCVKSQHTAEVLRTLALSAPESVPVICMQNGVSNEDEALRRFPHVYGVMVPLPAAYLSPGEVTAYSGPVNGILDIG